MKTGTNGDKGTKNRLREGFNDGCNGGKIKKIQIEK
jgi:hypothetical protein